MQIFSQINQDMQLFLAIIFALICGSFASFVTHRLGLGQGLFAANSACPKCGNKLKPKNLIPLISYFWQKGKCNNCGAKISARYPIIEAVFLGGFLTIYFALNRKIDGVMLLYFAISFCLISMIIIDLEHYFIPNSLQYILAILALSLLFVKGGQSLILSNLKGAFLYLFFAVVLWLFFYFIAKIEAIGIDDIKFFFLAGLILGQKNFLSFMILSGVFGLIFGGLWQKLKKDETFPFAPAICSSVFILMLFEKKIDLIDIAAGLLFFHGF